jgi:hypothetical protein
MHESLFSLSAEQIQAQQYQDQVDLADLKSILTNDVINYQDWAARFQGRVISSTVANAPLGDSWTFLHYVLSSQDQPLQSQEQREIVHWLLNNGAGIDAQTDYGNAPLIMTVELGDLQLAEELCMLGADIDLMSHDGNNQFQSNALLQAITHKHVDLIRMLIDQGATPFLEDSGWENFAILDVLHNINPELADLLKAKFPQQCEGWEYMPIEESDEEYEMEVNSTDEESDESTMAEDCYQPFGYSR